VPTPSRRARQRGEVEFRIDLDKLLRGQTNLRGKGVVVSIEKVVPE
jgi:hypothetical protein